MDAYAAIAGFYDREHQGFVDDVQFYLETVRDGPVLEVGVGTGRIAAVLAQEGYTVYGVDPSAGMLRLAQERLAGLPVELFHSSILDVRLPTRVRTALLPLNTLWHFSSVEEQLAVFEAVRAHMERDGLLICDCSNPLTLADRGATGQVRQRFRDDSLTVWSAAWDDQAEQLLELALTYDQLDQGTVRRSTAELSLRYVYRGELALLLRGSHFVPDEWYGWYDARPYEATSQSLIVLARAA